MEPETLELFRRKLLQRLAVALGPGAETDAGVVARIQASLERIARGTFGHCTICHGLIETERLRAMPDVERCGGCTHHAPAPLGLGGQVVPTV